MGIASLLLLLDMRFARSTVLLFAVALISASVLDRICGMSCVGEVARAASPAPQGPTSCHDPAARADPTGDQEPAGQEPCADHDSKTLVTAREAAAPLSALDTRTLLSAVAAAIVGSPGVGMPRRSDLASLHGSSPPRRSASVLRI